MTKSYQWISYSHVQSITIDFKIKLNFFVDYSYDHLLIAYQFDLILLNSCLEVYQLKDSIIKLILFIYLI